MEDHKGRWKAEKEIVYWAMYFWKHFSFSVLQTSWLFYKKMISSWGDDSIVKLVQSMGIAVEAAKALGNNSASQGGVKKSTKQIVKTNDRKQMVSGE